MYILHITCVKLCNNRPLAIITSPCAVDPPAINLEKIHFNAVQYEQPSPSSRRYFACQSTSYTCYQQTQALLVQEKYFGNKKKQQAAATDTII